MSTIDEKIAKVMMLIDGAKTPGEKAAAQAALKRLLASKNPKKNDRATKTESPGERWFWTTAEGEVIEYKDLKDDHLANIINMIKRNQRLYVGGMKAEYFRRCLVELEKEWDRRHPNYVRPDEVDIDFDWGKDA